MARLVALHVFASLALVVTLSGCASGSWTEAASTPYEQPPPVALGECPWSPGATPPPIEPADNADPVALTEAIAMPEDRFWDLIESIPDLPEQGDFERVASSLAGCAAADLVAFEARLTLALYALDDPQSADWYEQNDPSGLGFVSDDTFLYARCATVLGGRASWSDAVAQKTLDWGSDSPDLSGSSEYLLYLGLDAALAQGTDPYDYYDEVYSAIPISYETGSNSELWGD